MNRHFARVLRISLALVALNVVTPQLAAQGVSRGAGSLRLMTYNVFEGTDFGPILSARDQQAFFAAVGSVLAEVRASRPPERMQAVARQIASAAPTIVSVQEVNRWSSASLDPFTFQCGAMATEFDLLQELVDALSALGSPYKVAAQVTQFAIPALPGQLPDGQLVCAGLEDRNALLVRADLSATLLQWKNAQSGLFDNAVPVVTPAGTLQLRNGWASLDVSFLNRSFRMFTSHLALEPNVRRAQGVELRTIANASPLPVAIAMDANAQAAPLPLDPTYIDFIGEGYVDGWSAAEPDLPGLTCCQPRIDAPASQLVQRVDLVLTRASALQAQNAAVFGSTSASKTASGLWPSDHAGTAVQYSLESP